MAISALFGSHAQGYQTLSAQLAAYHNQFVRALNAGAGSYASAEAANVQQTLLNAINAPTQTLLGRPLIGNGATGVPGKTVGPAACCTATVVTAGPVTPPIPTAATADRRADRQRRRRRGRRQRRTGSHAG